jgi:hypothetical protein
LGVAVLAVVAAMAWTAAPSGIAGSSLDLTADVGEASAGDLVAQAAPPPNPQKPAADAGKPEVAPAAPKPPPAPPSDAEGQPPASPSPDLLASLAGERLAVAPNMFGDSYFSHDAHLVFSESSTYTLHGTHIDVALPLAGADRSCKLAEDGNTLPQDRVYFLYNHFDHAVDLSAQGIGSGASQLQRGLDLDRYTLGFEKMLGDRWSVELRMPFFGTIDFQDPQLPQVAFQSQNTGNLAIIGKRLLYSSERSAISAGLGLCTPTGGNFDASVFGGGLAVDNNALHLLPFAAMCWTPTCRTFVQAFIQVDTPTNCDTVSYANSLTQTHGQGQYKEQSLLYLDLECGYWLYCNCQGKGLTGLASVLEFHYTAPLNESNGVVLNRGTLLGSPDIQIVNPANTAGVVDMTVGLHAELAGNTLLRVAGCFPLSSVDTRFFDAEVLVQLERRF